MSIGTVCVKCRRDKFAPSRNIFLGYGQDPEQILQKMFEEIEGYDEMVVLRGIPFERHHVAPITGRACVGYVPNRRVVAFAKRFQIQERPTTKIANAIERVLKPQGVALVIKATHHCMRTRGIRKQGSELMTSRMLGCFRDNCQEFLAMTHASGERGQ
jgi:GTP cyclohydrolase I